MNNVLVKTYEDYFLGESDPDGISLISAKSRNPHGISLVNAKQVSYDEENGYPEISGQVTVDRRFDDLFIPFSNVLWVASWKHFVPE